MQSKHWIKAMSDEAHSMTLASSYVGVLDSFKPIDMTMLRARRFVMAVKASRGNFVTESTFFNDDAMEALIGLLCAYASCVTLAVFQSVKHNKEVWRHGRAPVPPTKKDAIETEAGMTINEYVIEACENVKKVPNIGALARPVSASSSSALFAAIESSRAHDGNVSIITINDLEWLCAQPSESISWLAAQHIGDLHDMKKLKEAYDAMDEKSRYGMSDALNALSSWPDKDVVDVEREAADRLPADIFVRVKSRAVTLSKNESYADAAKNPSIPTRVLINPRTAPAAPPASHSPSPHKPVIVTPHSVRHVQNHEQIRKPQEAPPPVAARNTDAEAFAAQEPGDTRGMNQHYYANGGSANAPLYGRCFAMPPGASFYSSPSASAMFNEFKNQFQEEAYGEFPYGVGITITCYTMEQVQVALQLAHAGRDGPHPAESQRLNSLP